MNLLSLINSLLLNIYCSTTLSDNVTIKLKRFISQFIHKLCNYFLKYLILRDKNVRCVTWKKNLPFDLNPLSVVRIGGCG